MQSTGRGRADALNVAGGRYHVALQGLENGRVIDRSEAVGSVSRALFAGTDWPAVMEVAASPDLRWVVSNTTEAGFVLDDADAAEGGVSVSFPAKLLAILLECFRAGLPGVTVLPCEPIEANGTILLGLVMEQAARWKVDGTALEWLRGECRWINNLVDRIVPGPPKLHSLLEKTSFLGDCLFQTDPGEKFLISIGAGDGGRDDTAPCEAVIFGDKAADFFDGLGVEGGIADDATLGNVLTPEFELRLDQADHAAILIEHRKHGWQDFGEGNEGKVHHREADFFADVLGDHVAGIELFLHDHAWIVAKFPHKLIGAYIHSVDAQRTALEQAIGETTGGGTHIHADPTGGIDSEGVECSFQFEPATPDKAGFLLDFERGIQREFDARFIDDPVAAAGFAGENQAFRLLAGIAESAGN